MPADSNVSNYGIDYAEIVVPLVKAVQELSAEIDSIKAAAASNQKIIPGNNGTGSTETTIQVELANNVILYQNEPNPFGESTSIRYYIPDNLATNAYIVFYDFYGKELKKIEITEKGYGKINADTKNLTGGIYSYSLMIDGNVKDSKKMVKE